MGSNRRSPSKASTTRSRSSASRTSSSPSDSGSHFTENARYGAGPAAVAIIELRLGTQFLLQHEYDHPQPGVWLLAGIDSNVDAQRAELADVRGLSANDYRWIKRDDRWIDPRPANRSNPGTGRPGPFRPVP